MYCTYEYSIVIDYIVQGTFYYYSAHIFKNKKCKNTCKNILLQFNE